MALQALIFDVDGTLADTERDGHRVAFNLAFEDAGLSWRWDAALYGELLAVTGGRERIAAYLARHHSGWRPEAPGTVAAVIAALHQAKNRHYEALVASGAVPLRAGIVRLIREARGQGLRLAIATTTSRSNVDALIAHLLPPDLSGAFEVIGSAAEVPVKKPAPDVYLWVLARLGLAPDETLAIEDSLNGVLAARAAGIPVIVTTNAYTAHERFDGALAVADGLGEPGAPAAILQAPDGDTSGLIDLALLRTWFAPRSV